uniref:SFRICE_019022 n=1 Tax=Spodoptera frugiperda TaxID=7108 RepID=A0A2H1WPI9_SPOFR
MYRWSKLANVSPDVPSTDAALRVVSQNKDTGRVTLNCTSSGVPGPNLTWSILGQQKIPHDFTGVSWNATSKLWDAWSVLTYTSTADTTAVCTPEVSTAGRLVKGKSAEYNSAECSKGLVILIVSAALYLVFLR